ncbi:MAG TPA: type III-B CRISPR module RAMP protein Cmr4 [Campylobacterales bacterium]|nr:type III-B CRISPR module RAMP protein Cmr4 [Campylobacterales bacterium]
MYKHKLYLIENQTSLHVGSGENNFGIIDKQIQRDVITTYPTIHSSSLKGALKEYCRYRHDPSEGEKFLSYIFGDEESAGKIRFLDAHLLSVPMRSDLNPYYHCVSPQSIQELLTFTDTFGIALKNRVSLEDISSYKGEEVLVSNGEPTIESERAKKNQKYDFSALEALVGSPVALVPNETFKEFLEDLPVIARNQLENGESKNLFYEEVLPRKSKLFTIISEPQYLNKSDETRLQNAFDRFSGYLTDKETIHIGANASIGYGVCCFKELEDV